MNKTKCELKQNLIDKKKNFVVFFVKQKSLITSSTMYEYFRNKITKM